MKITVKKLTIEESVLEVETKTGIEELVIKKTTLGHSYEDFAEWNITDEQYYRLESFVDEIVTWMDEEDGLGVVYDF